MQQVKPFWKSKAVWLGILMCLGAIAEYLAGLPAGASAIQMISGILTIIVRFITNTGIGRPPAPSA